MSARRNNLILQTLGVVCLLILTAALLTLPALPTSSARAAQPDAGHLPLADTPTLTPTPKPGTGSIGGHAWNDLNADGLAGADEPRLPGVTISAQGDAGLFSAVSDANGDYRLTGLVPGVYQVTAQPPAGYELTTQASFTVLVQNGVTLTFDFGAYAPPTPTPTATPQPALDASDAETAYCGGVYRGDTQTGKSNVSRYSCQPGWDESGPELVYRIEIAASQPLTVTLLSAEADVDLFLTRFVYPESCVAAGDTFLTFGAEPSVYLLAVDGYNGAAGPFTLRVDCPLGEQATATPTFTPSPRPTATVTPTRGPTLTPSITPQPRKVYLPAILRYYPYEPSNLTTLTLQGGVNGYMGATDTTLDSWEPGVSQGDDSDLRLFYSKTQSTNTRKAPVLRFALDFLPATAVVQSAVIRLYVPKAPSYDLRAVPHGLLRVWSEASATWNEASTGRAWAQPGAQAEGQDYTTWAGAAQRISAGGQWYTFDVTPLASQWVSNPTRNYGLILFAHAGDGDANVETQFASREYPDPNYRPQLVITYGVP